jgi:hypothetical protein
VNDVYALFLVRVFLCGLGDFPAFVWLGKILAHLLTEVDAGTSILVVVVTVRRERRWTSAGATPDRERSLHRRSDPEPRSWHRLRVLIAATLSTPRPYSFV